MQQKLRVASCMNFPRLSTLFLHERTDCLQQAHLKETVLNPGNVVISAIPAIAIGLPRLNGSPDISFKLNVGNWLEPLRLSRRGKVPFSLFKHVTNSTLNIGYYDGKLPTSLTFQLPQNSELRAQVPGSSEKLDNYYH